MTSQSLSFLPQELILDHLLPQLPVRDLLALDATSQELHALASDEVFWKRKCAEEYNFSGARTARVSGWKNIYKGLSNPKVYVWGNSDQGRLGLPSWQLAKVKPAAGKVPYPVRLRIPGVRIVDLIAGGWSFHALDSEGRLYAWGTLDGTMIALQRDGFSIAQKAASAPHRLELPVKIRSVSCGRCHAMALDASGGVWGFLSWGRPFLLTSPLLDRTHPDSTPIQVECGWLYGAVLTAAGSVLVYFTFGAPLQRAYAVRMGVMDDEGDMGAHARDADVPGGIPTIPCVTWKFAYDPVRLRPLPRLPTLEHASADGEDEKETETKLIQIAGMDGVLIGLTNKGHVLKFDVSNEDQVTRGQWEYLPLFSETVKVREHPTFASQEDEGQTEHPAVEAPEDLHITHVTANFRHFAAYSTKPSLPSIVLIGTNTIEPGTSPSVIPELQHMGVIAVEIGDYHHAALTADGRLYTWGAFSQGALGLGDPGELPEGGPGGFAPVAERRDAALRGFRSARGGRVPDVETPTEVRFDWGKEKRESFCFGVTAAGWHTGALVIDLEPHVDDEDDIPPTETNEEEHHLGSIPGQWPFTTPPFNPYGPGQMPIIPLRGRGIPFVRIGFAGRGANMGRGRGRGAAE